MNGPTEDTQVGRLVLARLLVAGEKGATTNDLKKALEPLIGHRWAGAALAGTLAETLAGLESAGLIARARKGKTERGTLTAQGRRLALEFLGLDELPPKATWDQLKKTSLAARALGLPTPSGKTAKLFSGDPGFKAALLRARFDLPLDDFPTFDQAIDALAWKLLGFEPGPKFTLKAVKAALLGRELEGRRQVDPKADFKKEAAKLLAREVGARQSGKDELRLAALRHWIDRASEAPKSESAPTPAPAPDPQREGVFLPPSPLAGEGRGGGSVGTASALSGSPAPVTPHPGPPPQGGREKELVLSQSLPSIGLEKALPPRAPAPLDLGTFARRVRETARTSPTGRFGDNKVFVVHIFRALSHDPSFAAMGLDGFKQRLAEANNARLLDLSRADMVEAMDPEEVSLSEVDYLGARYHFVLIE